MLGAGGGRFSSPWVLLMRPLGIPRQNVAHQTAPTTASRHIRWSRVRIAKAVTFGYFYASICCVRFKYIESESGQKLPRHSDTSKHPMDTGDRGEKDTATAGERPYYDLGTYIRPVTTKSKLAQTWFDRGLQWSYAFNQYDTKISFPARQKYLILLQ